MNPEFKLKSKDMFKEYISYTRLAAWDKIKKQNTPLPVKSLIENYIAFLNKLKLDESHPNNQDLLISQKFNDAFLKQKHLLNEFDFLNFYLHLFTFQTPIYCI